MSRPFRPLGHPLTELDRARVRELIDRLGERQAAVTLGVADRTLLRAVAGIGVYRGTAALIRERLRELGEAA